MLVFSLKHPHGNKASALPVLRGEFFEYKGKAKIFTSNSVCGSGDTFSV